MCVQPFLFKMIYSTHFFLAFTPSLHVKILSLVISDPLNQFFFSIFSLISLSEAPITIDHSLILKILSSLYFYDTGCFGFPLTYLFTIFTSDLISFILPRNIIFQGLFLGPLIFYSKTKRTHRGQWLQSSPHYRGLTN